MNKILAYIGYTILLINFLYYLKNLSKNGRAFFIFTLYLGTIVSINLCSEILIFLKFQNLILSHFYFISQFTILSFFYLNLNKNQIQKEIIKISLIICPSIILIQFVNNSSLMNSFNLLEILLTSVLLIVYSAFHFYNMLNDRKQFYYINIGIVVYLFGSTFLFFAIHLSGIYNLKLYNFLYPLNSILIIIFQIFIFIEWKKNYSKN